MGGGHSRLIWKSRASSRPPPTTLGTATIPPSGLFHTSGHVHTHPSAETNDTSVLELHGVLILHSDRPSLKRTQNSWEPEMVTSGVCASGEELH